MKPDLVKIAMDAGFPLPSENIIMMFVGGSQLHGVKLEGTDDMDVYGVFLETPESVVGLDKMEHFVTSTAKQAEKNGPGDVDIILYSLRKWITLAINGNPTALQFLFAPAGFTTPAWEELQAVRYWLLSADHANKYLGYARAQMDRLIGIRGQKNVKRPKVEQIHGYDTKYAMHVLRILIEGIELMQTGKVTFPCTQKDMLMKVRRGEIPLATVVGMADHYVSTLEDAYADAADKKRFSPINRNFISHLIVETYREHWRTHPHLFR